MEDQQAGERPLGGGHLRDPVQRQFKVEVVRQHVPLLTAEGNVVRRKTPVGGVQVSGAND